MKRLEAEEVSGFGVCCNLCKACEPEYLLRDRVSCTGAYLDPLGARPIAYLRHERGCTPAQVSAPTTTTCVTGHISLYIYLPKLLHHCFEQLWYAYSWFFFASHRLTGV